MLWFWFALIATILWGIVAIIQKHAITDELKDPLIATTLLGLTFFLPLSFFSLFIPVSTTPSVIFLSLLTGILYALAFLFYIKSVQLDEISRVMPVVMSYPLLVAILSFIILGEVFTLTNYAGIILIIFGVILISTKKHMTFRKAVLPFTFLALTFYALRTITIKLAVLEEPFLTTLPWVGLGGLLVALMIMARHHPHLRKASYLGVEHLIISNMLIIIAFLSFVYALSIGTASLVTVILSSEMLFVFLIATGLSKTHSHMIREEMRGSTLLLKAVAIALTLMGLALIV